MGHLEPSENETLTEETLEETLKDWNEMGRMYRIIINKNITVPL